MANSRAKWDEITAAIDSLRNDIDAQPPTLTLKDAQDRLTNILLDLNEARWNSLQVTRGEVRALPDLARVRGKAGQLRNALPARPASGGRRTRKLRRRSKKTRRSTRRS